MPGLSLVLMSTRGESYCAWPAENSVFLVVGPAVSAGLPGSFASHMGLSSLTAAGKGTVAAASGGQR